MQKISPKIRMPRRLRRQDRYYPRPMEAVILQHGRFKPWAKLLRIQSKKNPEQRIECEIDGKDALLTWMDAGLPERRYGSNLIGYTMTKLAELGVERVTGYAIDPSLGFFKKQGFHEGERTEYETTEVSITITEWNKIHKHSNRK